MAEPFWKPQGKGSNLACPKDSVCTGHYLSQKPRLKHLQCLDTFIILKVKMQISLQDQNAHLISEDLNSITCFLQEVFETKNQKCNHIKCYSQLQK